MENKMNIDWSKHIVETVVTENFRMDWIHIPGSVNRNVKFINTNGIMAVTGDYGNWIFCREFHPSADGFVSRGYWDEKLEIASEQKASAFDSEATEKAIDEFVQEWSKEGEELPEEITDWVDNLRSSVDDYHEYIYIAFRENPSDVYYEYVPFKKKRHVWLDCVYDAFNEICNRLKDEK